LVLGSLSVGLSLHVGSSPALLLLSGSGLALDRPVKDVIVLESLTNKEVSEELSEVRVVGLVVESKGSTVVQVDGEFVGESSAQDLGSSSHLYSQLYLLAVYSSATI
jgi:hypothetical protein